MSWSMLGLAAMVAVCSLAWAKGGPAERGAGFVAALLWLANFALGFASLGTSMTMRQLSSDGLLALGLLFFAIRYSSWWLGIAMIIQAAEFFINASFLGEEHPDLVGYVIRSNVTSDLILLAILGGTVASWRARLRARRLAAAPIRDTADPSPLLPPGAPSC